VPELLYREREATHEEMRNGKNYSKNMEPNKKKVVFSLSSERRRGGQEGNTARVR